MGPRTCVLILSGTFAAASAANAQISQPHAGDDTILVTPTAPIAPVTASLDVFATCASTDKSLLMPGTQREVTGANAVLLKLSAPLKTGDQVCVQETFVPAAGHAAIQQTATASQPVPPAPKVTIDPVTTGSLSLLVTPIPPPAGYTATVHIYGTCPPPAGAAQLDAAGILNTVDGSGDKLPVKLASGATQGQTLCAVEAFSGPAPVPASASSVAVTASNAAPVITSVTQFQGPTSTSKTGPTTNYVVQIAGTGFPAGTPSITLVPGISGTASVMSASATQVIATFTTNLGYSTQQVLLAYKTGETALSQLLAAQSCQWNTDLSSSFQLIDAGAAKTSWGAGISKNFRVIKFSVVNQCSLPVIIPLSAITVVPNDPSCVPHGFDQEIASVSKVSPSALDYVTSFYNEDKQVTGRRALFFNSLAATAALGSAIQPFFGKGFAQGVAILGGGFTTAAQTIYKDMSAQQLQALTSQGFGTAEQLAANNGSLQKYLFISRKIEDTALACALDKANVLVNFVVIPTITSATAQASPSPSQ